LDFYHWIKEHGNERAETGSFHAARRKRDDPRTGTIIARKPFNGLTIWPALAPATHSLSLIIQSKSNARREISRRLQANMAEDGFGGFKESQKSLSSNPIQVILRMSA